MDHTPVQNPRCCTNQQWKLHKLSNHWAANSQQSQVPQFRHFCTRRLSSPLQMPRFEGKHQQCKQILLIWSLKLVVILALPQLVNSTIGQLGRLVGLWAVDNSTRNFYRIKCAILRYFTDPANCDEAHNGKLKWVVRIKNLSSSFQLLLKFQTSINITFIKIHPQNKVIIMQLE